MASVSAIAQPRLITGSAKTILAQWPGGANAWSTASLQTNVHVFVDAPVHQMPQPQVMLQRPFRPLVERQAAVGAMQKRRPGIRSRDPLRSRSRAWPSRSK